MKTKKESLIKRGVFRRTLVLPSVHINFNKKKLEKRRREKMRERERERERDVEHIVYLTVFR